MTDHAKMREQAEQEIDGMRGTVLERLIPGSRPAEILDLLDEIEGNKKLIRMLQEGLFFWMPSIAGEDGPDGERAADDAMLLLGFEVGGEQDCYGNRMLRLNAEWMAKCEELRTFVAEIADGRIDPDKIAGKARKIVAKEGS